MKRTRSATQKQLKFPLGPDEVQNELLGQIIEGDSSDD